MTEQQTNDLVFRTNEEEKFHIDGNGPWKPQTPTVKLEISAKDNKEDVTELVEHVADMVEGVTVKTLPGGSIKMTGDAKITMSSKSINIG